MSDQPEQEFVSAYGKVRIRWDQCTTGLDCPCGEKELIVDDEPVTCKCGRVYRLVHRLEVAQ